MTEKEKRGSFSPVSSSKIRKEDINSPIQFSPRKIPDPSRKLILAGSDNEDEVFEFETPPPKKYETAKTPEGAHVSICRSSASRHSALKNSGNRMSVDEFIANLDTDSPEEIDKRVEQFIADKMTSPTPGLAESPLRMEEIESLELSPLRVGESTDTNEIQGRKLCFD